MSFQSITIVLIGGIIFGVILGRIVSKLILRIKLKRVGELAAEKIKNSDYKLKIGGKEYDIKKVLVDQIKENNPELLKVRKTEKSKPSPKKPIKKKVDKTIHKKKQIKRIKTSSKIIKR